MTIQEANVAALAQSNISQVGAFSKAFRTDELGNIENGETITIPEDFVILSQRIMRGGQTVMVSDGNGGQIPATAEFIKCQADSGRIVNFFPTSLTKVAFRVDPETGKDVATDRIVRTEGDVVNYVKNHPDMNETMNNLKGCQIKFELKERVPTRAFGVSNEDAKKENVTLNTIGRWTLVGAKKPVNW